MSLKALQERAGVDPDGAFGPNTFKAAGKALGITNHERAVHFFAQCAHESAMFRVFEENLNYSDKGLMTTFKRHFDSWEEAKEYARKPEKIANRVYRSRMGNGDEASGDGWRFRGRGAIQLTGKYNYEEFRDYMDVPDLLDCLDDVSSALAFDSAMFFFTKNNLWEICDKGLGIDVVRELTRAINGGTNGLDHRLELTNEFRGYAF